MNSSTKKITTPLAKAVVELKDWITGGEAEYIEEALMAGVEVKPDIAGKTASIGKFNTDAIKEQTHREIGAFVVSVNGDTKEVIKAVMELPEDDYEFVKSEIAQRRSKKKLA